MGCNLCSIDTSDGRRVRWHEHIWLHSIIIFLLVSSCQCCVRCFIGCDWSSNIYVIGRHQKSMCVFVLFYLWFWCGMMIKKSKWLGEKQLNYVVHVWIDCEFGEMTVVPWYCWNSKVKFFCLSQSDTLWFCQTHCQSKQAHYWVTGDLFLC